MDNAAHHQPAGAHPLFHQVGGASARPYVEKGQCPRRVKMRNTRNEQMFSALPSNSDIAG
jgi:hypothetical protein